MAASTLPSWWSPIRGQNKKWRTLATSHRPSGESPTAGQNQKGTTCGRTGYITTTVGGAPQQGRKIRKGPHAGGLATLPLPLSAPLAPTTLPARAASLMLCTGGLPAASLTVGVSVCACLSTSPSPSSCRRAWQTHLRSSSGNSLRFSLKEGHSEASVRSTPRPCTTSGIPGLAPSVLIPYLPGSPLAFSLSRRMSSLSAPATTAPATPLPITHTTGTCTGT